MKPVRFENTKPPKKKKPLKPKKCKVCELQFIPRSGLQRVCSPPCAIELNKINKSKAFDAETRKRKAAIKSRSDWLREAQQACNRYIRERDRALGCISCGRHHKGQYHAGHFLSVGAFSELRFNTFNINKQCSACNNFLGGNIVHYRPNLIKKIGIERVEWLEGPHDPKNYTIDDLKRIKAIFNRKFKRICAR